jgi:alpha-mannosidase
MGLKNIINLACFILSMISVFAAVVEAREQLINVHLIAHTHDDPGWLKTVDEYYYGSNSSIYRAGVQYILDSVIQSLTENHERKFVYVEMSFFTKWYDEQRETVKKRVKLLVKNGQLSFANGGWCMHDEASSHYVSMIDQTTIGHQFLKKEFNYTPSVGWQIDPFGHSSTQAGLLGSDLGFNSLFFGRIDYQDHALRVKEKRLEFIWKGSQSISESQIFTGVFSSGNYGPPESFCFDTGIEGYFTTPTLFNPNPKH